MPSYCLFNFLHLTLNSNEVSLHIIHSHWVKTNERIYQLTDQNIIIYFQSILIMLNRLLDSPVVLLNHHALHETNIVQTI
jgi:hypothetical protein